MAKNIAPVTVRFNKVDHVFKNRAAVEKIVKAAATKAAPRDASNLLHRVYLPGVKTPVSLQWAVLHLLKTPAIVTAEVSGQPRGAYHPRQALSAMTKLNTLGVKVESVAPSTTYAAYSKVAQKNLAAATKAASKTTRKTTARKTTRKAASK